MRPEGVNCESQFTHTGVLSQREYVRLKCSEKWRTGDLLLQDNIPERSVLSVQKFLAMKHASRPQPSALPIRGAAFLSLFPKLKVIFMRRRLYDIVKENLQTTYLDRQIQGSMCFDKAQIPKEASVHFLLLLHRTIRDSEFRV